MPPSHVAHEIADGDFESAPRRRPSGGHRRPNDRLRARHELGKGPPVGGGRGAPGGGPRARRRRTTGARRRVRVGFSVFSAFAVDASRAMRRAPDEPPPPPPPRGGADPPRSLARCPRTSGVSIARRASWYACVFSSAGASLSLSKRSSRAGLLSRSSGLPGAGAGGRPSSSPSPSPSPSPRPRAAAPRAARGDAGRFTLEPRSEVAAHAPAEPQLRRVQREGFLLRPGLSPRRRRRRERLLVGFAASRVGVGGSRGVAFADPRGRPRRLRGRLERPRGGERVGVDGGRRGGGGGGGGGAPPRDAGAPPFRTRRGGARGRSSWT